MDGYKYFVSDFSQMIKIPMLKDNPITNIEFKIEGNCLIQNIAKYNVCRFNIILNYGTDVKSLSTEWKSTEF